MNILIVGAGSIAREYIDVCLSLGTEPLVVTRGKDRAETLRQDIQSITVIDGGLQSYLEDHSPPNRAILATPIESLASHCQALIRNGVERILAEKPLALQPNKARDLLQTAEQHAADVYIGYNRRMYASVRRAADIIDEDGGVLSMTMDFTEAIARLDTSKYADPVLRHWGIANSSHVIDTAFYLCGDVEKIRANQEGSAVDWHSAGSVFYGSGRTVRDVPFSYHANWGAPGRWKIEINTADRKLLFAPMERLQVQQNGSFELTEADVDYTLDEEFKPGFYRQTAAFINETDQLPLSLDSLPDKIDTLYTIFGYSQ
jgi:predicted dehydrogenase